MTLRVAACVCATGLAAGASLGWAGPAAAGTAVVPPTVTKVTAADLGPGRPWLGLRDDPGNDGRLPGIQEVTAFADPVRFNGSLHLIAGPGQQSQAAHNFGARIPLSTVTASELSYDSYVKSATSTGTGTAANLQLPMVCQGAFTTISFQPGLATDSEGRTGVVPDSWQHFAAGPASVWRTSRAVPGIAALPAGADAPLSDYAAACTLAGDGVMGVIGNVGGLGDTNATLDTYVDNLTVNGTVYDFAVPERATALVPVNQTVPSWQCNASGRYCYQNTGPGATATGTATFSNPPDGPEYRRIGARLIFSAPRGISPGDLTVTSAGRDVKLTAGPGRTVIAMVAPSPRTDLAPGGTYRTPLRISFAKGTFSFQASSRDQVTLSAGLLADGYEPLQWTGVVARATVRR